jgi:hypothetical protein
MAKKERGREKKNRRRAEEAEPQDDEAQPGAEQEASAEQDAPKQGSGPVDISDTPAPSIGPHTVFERDTPEERLARHEQSETDAMGLDKRREVIGGRYSPSLARQLTMYGIFLAVVAAITVGFIILAGELDKPPESYPDKAPWARADAPEVKPQPIDFPAYGNPGPDSQ